MALFKKKQRADPEAEKLKSFLDMIAPSLVKFEFDRYFCGNSIRCVWALREYPTATDDQAILRHLGEMHGVTLHVYTRIVTPLEESRIVHNAEIRNRMKRNSTQNIQQAVEAESNLQDVKTLVGSMHRNKESLMHCAVYMELIASDQTEFEILQNQVTVELTRAKLNVDKLKLRQQQGFCCVSPCGYNAFGTEYERVLPAGSVANLFPFNYSGKTDRKGFYIGKDKCGSNIVVDFDQRDEDKTSANILILGNTGQGKSFLMKLLLLNFLEAGKSIITLDVEHEQWEMCRAVGGCFADIIEGTYKINLLEPRCWDTDADPYDVDAPSAFRQSTRLAQHISFLKDVLRCYKDFTTAQIDTIEILLMRLYTEWGITEKTDFSQMKSEDYPILSELYDYIEIEYLNFDEQKPQLYTKEMLQQVLLGLYSMCKGADAKFFNGHSNLTSTRFLVFGVKGLNEVAANAAGVEVTAGAVAGDGVVKADTDTAHGEIPEEHRRFAQPNDDEADSTGSFRPAFEPGSVFELVSKGRLAAAEPKIEVNGYTSDQAKTTEDYTEQFAIANCEELLPFLAMNPLLYDDLYNWLEDQGKADIDAALENNEGYKSYRKAVGK